MCSQHISVLYRQVQSIFYITSLVQSVSYKLIGKYYSAVQNNR